MPSKHICLKLPKHSLLDKLFSNFDYVGTSVLEFVCHTPESYTDYQYYYSPISGPLFNYFGNGTSLLFTEDYCYLSTGYLKELYVQDEATYCQHSYIITITLIKDSYAIQKNLS